MTDFSFTYRIIKSQRKTLAIHIKQGMVEVRAPFGLDAKEIYHFLNKKSDWIHQKLQLQHIQQQQKPRIAADQPMLFLGQTYWLKFQQGALAIEQQATQFVIHCPDEPAGADYFKRFLQQSARQYISQRVQVLSQLMGEQQRITALHFRKTKSQWGHCTRQGKLQFNWLLIMAPKAVIDYVIIHELSHLQQMNHSPAFWRRVAQFCPDYAQHNQWLKEHGHRLFLDA